MIAGLDLASKDKNPSGVCIYPNTCKTLKRDEEILRFLKDVKLVAVDAPLTYEEPWRDAEKELISLGYRPLPLSMQSMRELYQRAKRLQERFGGTMIETFVQPLRTKLVDYFAERMGWNKHERDAFLCSLVAKAYLEGKAYSVGRKHKIYLVKRKYVEKEVKGLLG